MAVQISMVSWVCSQAPGPQQAEEFREWKSIAGTSMTAKLVSYDEGSSVVRLERKDGTVITLQRSQLGGSDWDYLRKRAEAAKPPATGPDTYGGFVKVFEGITLDMRFQGRTSESKLNEARLSPVPDGMAIDRSRMPVTTGAQGRDAELENSLISHLLWWDQVGFLPIPKNKAKNAEDKEKWVRREFRCKWQTPELQEISNSLVKYLAQGFPSITRLNATKAGYYSPKTLASATRGLDLVILNITAYRGRSIAWVNPVVITQAGEDGSIAFTMWRQQFRGRLSLAPKEELPQRTVQDQETYNLTLTPDPNNPEMEHIQKNEWTLRVISPGDLLVFSPTSLADPTPVGEDCQK
ncbi:MAG: hypothetical protein ACAH88_02885 [Roseimicrobium sp.]